LPNLGHRTGHVDFEFMRRRVLAGMKAGAAVMAKIGEVMKIGGGKSEPALHRRKNRAKPLAVAARIANAHHAGCFLGRF